MPPGSSTTERPPQATEAGCEEQRAQILGELAGGIVHDVNNLLTLVLGVSDYLETEAAPDQRERLQLIRTDLHRGATMLRQLLGFARVTDGVFERMGCVCALAEAASAVQCGMERGIHVALECAEDLGEIEGDPFQIQQILVNLCVRARDALPDGGTITLRGARRRVTEDELPELGADASAGCFAVLSVSDTGPAIPPEEHQRIFNPFQKSHQTGRSTGLGLATVMRVVRRHRGFVTLESEPGRGNTFACHFPAVETTYAR